PPLPANLYTADPDVIVLAMLRNDPAAWAHHRERIEGAVKAIDNLVEHARNDKDVALLPFMKGAAWWVRLRNHATAALAVLEGAGPPELARVASEVYNLAGSIRRWENQEDLRREYARLIHRLSEEQAQEELGIRHLLAQRGTFFASDPASA